MLLIRKVRYAASHFIVPFFVGILIAVTVFWFRTKSDGLVGQHKQNAMMDVDNEPSSSTVVIPSVVTNSNSEELNNHGEEEELQSPMAPEEAINPEAIDHSHLNNTSAAAVDQSRVEQEEERARKMKEREERASRGSWNCRHRWTKWLKQNQMYIPPTLADLQARYNRLHDKSLRELNITEALGIPLTSPRNSVRFIVWRPVGEDFAGRLLSLISAYFLALLTDRVMLINFPYVRHLFCEPFSRSSWIYPADRLADLNNFIPMEQVLQRRSPVRIARLKLSENFDNDDSIFLTCNGNIKTMLTHAQILLVESPVGFVHLIQTNLSHQKRIQEIFESSSIHSTLMNTFLHPSNDLWFRLIDSYHVHYTNDHDRPGRVAVYFNTSTISDIGHLQVKHQLKCATEKIESDFLSRGKVIYWAGSNNQPAILGNKIITPPTSRIITAFDENKKKGYLADWRRLLADVWMASWAEEYVMDSVSVNESHALLLHYYRGKSSWVCGAVGPEGECVMESLPADFLGPNNHDCVAFRQSWRSKHKK